MSEFFSAGGFGMIPTLLFGFLLIACSILFMFRPEPRYLALLVGMGATTFSAGLLGTCSGVMNTLRYLKHIPSEEWFKVVAAGCSESLHVLFLALILMVVSGLFVSIGAVRTIGLFRSPAA
jgi:hypothetical protein